MQILDAIYVAGGPYSVSWVLGPKTLKTPGLGNAMCQWGVLRKILVQVCGHLCLPLHADTDLCECTYSMCGPLCGHNTSPKCERKQCVSLRFPRMSHTETF